MREVRADLDIGQVGQAHAGAGEVSDQAGVVDYQLLAGLDGSTVTPRGCRVACQVAGNFPGSPVMLTFDFQLDGSLIAALEIKS